MRRFRLFKSLVIMLGIVGANVGPAAAQDATPPAAAGFPIAPDPAMCIVEPRPIADFEALVAAPDTAPATPDASAGAFTPPAGEPADAETTALVTEVAVDIFACYAAGDWLRASALWTDDYLTAEDAAVPYTEDDLAYLAASPVPDEPDARLTLTALREITVLTDGRVGSFLDVAYPDGSTEMQYGIVELVDGRYRLDEVAFVGPAPGTPTP